MCVWVGVCVCGGVCVCVCVYRYIYFFVGRCLLKGVFRMSSQGVCLLREIILGVVFLGGCILGVVFGVVFQRLSTRFLTS